MSEGVIIEATADVSAGERPIPTGEGLTFEKRDENDKTLAEIDILLENDTTIMAVEVKSRPAEKDIAHHIKRLEILRDYRRKKNDQRKIQGAIAGAIFGVPEKQATIEAGLYVLEQSGDTMRIDIPNGFVPRVF